MTTLIEYLDFGDFRFDEQTCVVYFARGPQFTPADRLRTIVESTNCSVIVQSADDEFILVDTFWRTRSISTRSERLRQFADDHNIKYVSTRDRFDEAMSAAAYLTAIDTLEARGMNVSDDPSDDELLAALQAS